MELTGNEPPSIRAKLNTASQFGQKQSATPVVLVMSITSNTYDSIHEFVTKKPIAYLEDYTETILAPQSFPTLNLVAA